MRIKVGLRDGEVWHAMPEHDDVRAVAAASGQSTLEVHRAALAAWTPSRR